MIMGILTYKINYIYIFNLVKKLFIKNIYTISLYTRRIASAIIIFFLARYLSITEYGLYSSYANITSILLLIANFGFNEYILVSSKNKLNKVKRKLSFFLIFSTFTVFVLLVLSSFIKMDNNFIFSLILIKAYLDNTFFSLILTYYQSANKFFHISLINIIYSFGLITISIISYIFHLQLKFFLLLCILLGCLNFIYSSITAKLHYFSVIRKFKQYYKIIDKKLIYFGLVMVTALIYSQLPSLYVSLFISKEQAALYFASYNIFSILLLISASQVQQIMPNMINASSKNLLNYIKKNIIYITIINIAILIFLIFFGKTLLILIYSKTEYIKSYTTLIIGAIGNIFMSAGGILACFMTSKGFQKNKFYFQIEFILITILLIIILNPLKIKGAVLAYALISLYAFMRYLRFMIKKIKEMEKYET